jgi:integrase/recombinase XerD
MNRNTWIGRRDYAFLLTAIQTGLRLSEMTSLRQQDVSLGAGAHVRCEGKGRKERRTPLAKPTAAVLDAWIKYQGKDDASRFLFPSTRGGPLSADAVQHLVAKYAKAAQKICPSLTKKKRQSACSAPRRSHGVAASRCRSLHDLDLARA